MDSNELIFIKLENKRLRYNLLADILLILGGILMFRQPPMSLLFQLLGAGLIIIGTVFTRLSRGRQGRTAPIACPAASTSGGADCWGGGPYCGGTKRWPLPQESVLQCMLDKQSGQNLHFLCKSLKQVGDCFLLGLQMDTI